MNDNEIFISNYLDAVFNKKDVSIAESFWADDMVQHNPAMPNGLEVLREFINNHEINIVYEQ